MRRRSFLIRGSGSVVAVALGARAGVSEPGSPERISGLSAAQWRTLAAVQEQLFPSEPEVPGAADIDALAYLRWVLDAGDTPPEERTFIRSGVERVVRVSLEETGEPFPRLSEERREKILRRVEKDPEGARWLRGILEYIMEALLTDPVYGGNPKGIGWRWLEHHPGYRRPSRDKRYFLLSRS